jgi:hypothetical protein
MRIRPMILPSTGPDVQFVIVVDRATEEEQVELHAGVEQIIRRETGARGVLVFRLSVETED